MEPQMWQQLQGGLAGVLPPPLPLGEVPMKGVILANRKTIFHKTRVCPRLAVGACHLGSKCNFAHSLEELRPPPNLDRTKLCPSVLHPGTVCPGTYRGEECRFAHSRSEMRHTPNMFKTNMCLKWIRGKCKKELQCNHAHGHQELKFYRSLAMASGSRDFARESEATLSRRRKQNVAAAAAAPSLAGLAEILYAAQQQRQWTDSFVPADSSSCEDQLSLLVRISSAANQERGNNSTSVNAALALCEELLRCRARGDMQGTVGALGTPFQDDSTSAMDECSDFSSFSSSTLSDALRSAASTAASYGGPLHPAELESVRPSLAAPSSGASCSSSSKSDLSLDVDRTMLLKMLAQEGDPTKGSRQSERHQELLVPERVAAADSPVASVLAEKDSDTTNTGLGALQSSLARLCLTDDALRRHCFAEPPPGFEGTSRHQPQQQQHAVLDLDRLAASENFD